MKLESGVLALIVLTLFAGCTGTTSDAGSAGAPTGEEGAWLTYPLTDVRSGETFTVADLNASPVLVESFAVWCTTCLRQQRELQRLQAQDVAFTPVTVNTDPNEDTAKVRNYLREHGFDWRYVVAPSKFSQMLQQEFGSQVLVAPSAPIILVCPDGEYTYLDTYGVKTADDLQSSIEQRCT